MLHSVAPMGRGRKCLPNKITKCPPRQMRSSLTMRNIYNKLKKYRDGLIAIDVVSFTLLPHKHTGRQPDPLIKAVRLPRFTNQQTIHNDITRCLFSPACVVISLVQVESFPSIPSLSFPA